MEFYPGFESTPKRKYVRREKVMKTKPKYRLIKEYPGSEPLGTIFKFGYEGWASAGVEHKDENGVTSEVRFSTPWTPDYFGKWVGEYYELVK